MIYLDNAATTMRKPPEVIQAVAKAMGSLGNDGRGVNGGSLSAGRVVFSAAVDGAGHGSHFLLTVVDDVHGGQGEALLRGDLAEGGEGILRLFRGEELRFQFRVLFRGGFQTGEGLRDGHSGLIHEGHFLEAV